MACPVEFEAALGARYIRIIETHVNIFGNLVIRKFDESIANRSVFYFISDKLHLSDTRNTLKQALYVGFVHPRLDIANPQCFSI